MWIIPSGIFGWWGRKSCRDGYDVWALGSDIWKIRKIPLLGNKIIRFITQGCRLAFADGLKLCRDVTEISGVACEFMPTSRQLPPACDLQPLIPSDKRHLLFVGRYHVNKGPDLLVDALALLGVEERNGIMVHMFGVGPMEEELKAKITALGLEKTVKLNGIIQPQQFADMLARVDYELIPSRIESIPVVFSDAIQCGVPVISMPTGDLGGLIAEYECGIVAEEISAKSFCDAIRKGLTVEKSAFQSGVSRTATKFNVINAVRQWQKS
jgi:glycosyltransferase involved in cell wall biosynthesis